MNRGWDAEVEARALATADAPGPDWDVCPHCEGSGSVTEESSDPDEGYRAWLVACPVCKGDGRVDTSPCIACGGRVYDHDEGCPLAPEEVQR